MSPADGHDEDVEAPTGAVPARPPLAPPARPAREALALLLYGCLVRALLPLVLLRYWWRGGVEPLYRSALGERLGLYRRKRHAHGAGRLWIHAVSLGETRAAGALIDQLRAQRPGIKILLTHGTATGREAGVALLRDGDGQAWLPWDMPGAVRRFLAWHRPVAGVLMETEVWPALLHAAQRQGVPMTLANARLSAGSLRQSQRLAALMQPAVRGLCVLAQTESDAQRLRVAGAQNVRVCGNLKFDMTPESALLARGREWRRRLARPVVLAASTREGEEALLLSAWKQAVGAARTQAAPPLLLIVPRHPQRFDEVAALCANTGLTLARRSDWRDPPSGDAGVTALGAALEASVWLGDSLGELPLYYACADVALLGGSFEPWGGQNLIEAAACGCPLLIGPSTHNFAEAAGLALDAGAATRVPDLPAAVAAALALLTADDKRQRQAQQALAFAHAHRGAAQRMAAVVLAGMPAV